MKQPRIMRITPEANEYVAAAKQTGEEPLMVKRNLYANRRYIGAIDLSTSHRSVE